MNLYQQLKHKQQAEVNSFPLAFAFSDKQFEESMLKLGLKPTDTHKIVSIGYGGFMRKSDAKDFEEMMRRHKKEIAKAIADDKNGSGFVKDMFAYELANHEYGYTGDLEDTFNALNLTMDRVKKDPKLLKGLNLALKRYRSW